METDIVEPQHEKKSKKEKILSLFDEGRKSVEDIASETSTKPSYVAQVLKESGLTSVYFDLYTSTQETMNAYSRHFAGQLGFRDVEASKKSLNVIDNAFRSFEMVGDRAGSHHALVMALTMFNRARWSGKLREAEIFRKWLVKHLKPIKGEAEKMSH